MLLAHNLVQRPRPQTCGQRLVDIAVKQRGLFFPCQNGPSLCIHSPGGVKP